MFSLFGAFFEFLFVLRASLVLLCCSVSQKIWHHPSVPTQNSFSLPKSISDAVLMINPILWGFALRINTVTILQRGNFHFTSEINIPGRAAKSSESASFYRKNIYFGEINNTFPQSLDIADCPISPWSYIPFDGRYTFRLPLPCWYFYWQQSVLFPPLGQLPTSEVPPRHLHCNEINNSNNLDYKSHAQHHIPLHRRH